MKPRRWWYFSIYHILIVMFTIEKSKLFFNDPKFLAIKDWNSNSQEEAVNKIFGGQRQLCRSEVTASTLAVHST